jgi:maltose/moltooligosaccharide transporter
MGVYMGIFNFFIVIPEVLASLALQPIVKQLFGDNPVKVVMMGGASLLLAALLMLLVQEPAQASDWKLQEITEDELNPQSATPPESLPL